MVVDYGRLLITYIHWLSNVGLRDACLLIVMLLTSYWDR